MRSQVTIFLVYFVRYFHVPKWHSAFFPVVLFFFTSGSSVNIFFPWYRNVGAQPRRSISFNGPAKGAQVRGGYVGANQSRMALSKTMVIPSDIRTTEKKNISSTKVVTQVTDFRILSLFENDTMKNLTAMLKVENMLLWNNNLLLNIGVLQRCCRFSSHIKANIAIKWVTWNFGFPNAYKNNVYTICRLLSVQ